jgi:protoporphyrinogen oxidase
MKKAIIIGGGPAGLTAALEFLRKTGIKPIVIEQSKYWGGITRTVNYKGNMVDIGGHRFFSKSDVIMDWWQSILPIQPEAGKIKISYQNKQKEIVNSNTNVVDRDKVMLVRKRKSRIYYMKTFFDYPVSLSYDTISKLGFWRTFVLGLSYMKSRLFPIKPEENLEDFFVNRFGKKLYETFFKEYTEKVWGIPCNKISAEWGAQRIKGLSISKAILHILKKTFTGKSSGEKDISQKDTETSLIEYFLYPKYGAGQMWEEVADIVKNEGGELYQNIKVIRIEVDGKKIQKVKAKNIETGEIIEFSGDYFISTMPVQELINSLSTDVPANVKEISDGLLYRDFITVGILVKKLLVGNILDNWIYIQEPGVKIGRLQIFNNWSPYMVSDTNTYWIGAEYFCNEGDAINNMSDIEMSAIAVNELAEIGMIDKADFLDSIVIRMPKTYPAYFGTYSRFSEVREYLDGFENLFLVGRNGMHKYNNQDHSMLTAITAVDNIKNNVPSRGNIWEINTEDEYNESR